MSEIVKSGQHYVMRLSLTTEGWIYLIILSFVSVCAVLRNVNLLIVFTGVMLAALFLGWRIGRSVIRSIVAKRLLQTRIHAGQLVNIQWQIANKSPLPVWYVDIADRIVNLNESTSTDAKVKRRETKARAGNSHLIFDFVPGGSTKYMSYRALFTHRGHYELGPATVSSMFPMGLVKNWFRIDATESFYVAPRLGKLSPDWEQRISSLAFGSQSARRRRGPDPDEFYAIRSWRSGDNLRDIHWRTTAKYQTPMVKQFDQKSNRDFAIVLDLFEPNFQHAADEVASDLATSSRIELVLSFAATILGQITTMAQGRVVLSSAADESVTFTSASHSDFLASAMRYLATVRCSNNPQLSEAVMVAANNVSPGTPVVVVSPRDLTEEMLRAELGEKKWLSLKNQIRPLPVESHEFKRLFAIEDPHFDALINELKLDLPKDANEATEKEAENVSA